MLNYKMCYKCGVQESKTTLRQGEKHTCKIKDLEKWQALSAEERVNLIKARGEE